MLLNIVSIKGVRLWLLFFIQHLKFKSWIFFYQTYNLPGWVFDLSSVFGTHHFLYKKITKKNIAFWLGLTNWILSYNNLCLYTGMYKTVFKIHRYKCVGLNKLIGKIQYHGI